MSNRKRPELAVVKGVCPICAAIRTLTLNGLMPWHWPTYTQEVNSAEWCTGSLGKPLEKPEV